MDLKEQKNTIELNFEKAIKILENESNDNVYGFVIPIFNDIMENQYFLPRDILILAIKEFYSDFILDKEVYYQSGFIEAFKKYLKEGDEQKIFRCLIMAFLLGFLDTTLICKDKERVLKRHKKKKQNKKKREQKKRNKWKKPPSPSLDYKTYVWNIPEVSPPIYAL